MLGTGNNYHFHYISQVAHVPGWRGSVYRSANAGWQLRGEQPGMVQRVTEMHTHQTASFSQLSSANLSLTLGS